MSPIRLWRDMRDLYRGLADMLVLDDSESEEAGYELAVASRRFSRNTQAVVDDKLNFSATLMRAGEVDAANRLLQEFQQDVAEEEAALIERVNEVKVAEAVRRDGITKVRLARMLAVAILGSGLLSFSAAGMALAGYLRDRAQEANAEAIRVSTGETTEVLASRVAREPARNHPLKRVRIGDTKLLLTASQLRTIRELGGTADESALQGIIEFLPDTLASKVQHALVAATGTVENVKELEEETLAELKAKAKRKARQAEKAAQAEAQEDEDTTPPSPEPSEQPTDDQTGSSDDDDSAQRQDDNDGRQGDDDDELDLPGGDAIRPN